MWTTSKTIAVLVLLLIQAFASSSETAFFSLNRFQLRRIKDRYKPAYNRIRTLLGHPSRLLITILLINEIVDIAISTLVTSYFQHNWHTLRANYPWLTSYITAENEWIVTALLSMIVTIPLLVIFADITPKVIAAKMNRVVAMLNSRLLIILYYALYPILWTLDSVISFILRRFKAVGRDHLSKTMSVLSEEDFMLLMEQGHREGTVDPAERKLIKNVFEFDDSTVQEVMTPITQAFSISALATIAETLPEIRSQKYSRVPVYQKTRRKIAGILYVKDLLAVQHQSNIKTLEVKSLMTRPMFVTPDLRLSVLFRNFKESKTHMAICTDRNGDALGVVTMEDVLESIFGEIEDERDIK